MSDFLQTVKERVVIYDGAMGTSIHLHNPSLDDYWGKENCSEVLTLSRPDIVREIHASFLQVGCDVIETNTFGGTGIVLREFELRSHKRRQRPNVRCRIDYLLYKLRSQETVPPHMHHVANGERGRRRVNGDIWIYAIIGL